MNDLKLRGKRSSFLTSFWSQTPNIRCLCTASESRSMSYIGIQDWQTILLVISSNKLWRKNMVRRGGIEYLCYAVILFLALILSDMNISLAPWWFMHACIFNVWFSDPGFGEYWTSLMRVNPGVGRISWVSSDSLKIINFRIVLVFDPSPYSYS